MFLDHPIGPISKSQRLTSCPMKNGPIIVRIFKNSK